jgi:multiple sugar transport system ATP-binding protein
MAPVNILNVQKRFGAVNIIHGIDIDIKDGEFVVLVGPSGCGKSTLLRMIAGLEELSDGEIHIGAREVSHLPARDRDIAMVFQNYALYPHMTVKDNMGFALKLKKVSAEETRAKVDRAAAILGLEKLLDRYPRQLSGGQRQRVAMGATRRSSCSTSRFPTSTPSCACRCAARSRPCTSASARPPSMLPTTRWKP